MRATVLVLSLTLAATAACAQSAPRPAQSQAGAAGCAEQVRRMQAAPELRVQGGRTDQETRRAQARIYLDQAAQAAAYGDERGCRQRLGAAQTALD